MGYMWLVLLLLLVARPEAGQKKNAFETSIVGPFIGAGSLGYSRRVSNDFSVGISALRYDLFARPEMDGEPVKGFMLALGLEREFSVFSPVNRLFMGIAGTYYRIELPDDAFSFKVFAPQLAFGLKSYFPKGFYVQHLISVTDKPTGTGSSVLNGYLKDSSTGHFLWLADITLGYGF